MTTPLRTALDLGRQRWPEPALTALDALHRLGAFSVEELLAEVDRFKRHALGDHAAVGRASTRTVASQSGGDDGGALELAQPAGPATRAADRGRSPEVATSLRRRRQRSDLRFGVRVPAARVAHRRAASSRRRSAGVGSGCVDDERLDHRNPCGRRTSYGRHARIEDVILDGVRRARRRHRSAEADAPTRRVLSAHEVPDSAPLSAPGVRRLGQKMISPALRRLRRRATASSRMSAASVSLRRSFT